MKTRIGLFALVLAAGMALGALLSGDEMGAKANATEAVSTPASVCTSQFVTNVKVKAFQGNQFEVTWDYAPPDPCMKPDGFEIVCTVKRKVGGGVLGQKTMKVGPTDRRGIFNFASAFGVDQVAVSVKSTITLKSFATTGLDL